MNESGCGPVILPERFNESQQMKLELRFLAKVKPVGDCCEWQAAKAGKGYGYFMVMKNGVKTMAYAHRVAWELSHGPIPAGLFVLHRCDNPACVKPAHLFLGTQKENMQDCAKKGRWKNQSRFTPEIASEIRRRYAAGGITQVELGAEFGMTFQHVSSIVTGKRWANHE